MQYIAVLFSFKGGPVKPLITEFTIHRLYGGGIRAGIPIGPRDETSKHIADLKAFTKAQKFRLKKSKIRKIKSVLITLLGKQGVFIKHLRLKRRQPAVQVIGRQLKRIPCESSVSGREGSREGSVLVARQCPHRIPPS
jgi:hypothetical protein